MTFKISKMFSFSLALAAFLSLFLATGTHAGGFVGTCNTYCYNETEHTLRGSCKDKGGDNKWSAINLNRVIAFKNNWMKWSSDGGFADKCSGCFLLNRGSYLQCTCAGAISQVLFDLNSDDTDDNHESVSNEDGLLCALDWTYCGVPQDHAECL